MEIIIAIMVVSLTINVILGFVIGRLRADRRWDENIIDKYDHLENEVRKEGYVFTKKDYPKYELRKLTKKEKKEGITATWRCY